jgi:DNA modification methylase
MRTPKQKLKQKAAYQYYAGFSSDFVCDILEKYASPGTRILDPWNGSGTTTGACLGWLAPISRLSYATEF